MKLVVDAQPVLGQRAGIGAYVFEIMKRLPGYFQDDEIQLTLFRFLKDEPVPETLLQENVSVIYHRFFPRKLLEGSLKAGVPLPFPLFSRGGDCFLFPNFIVYPTGGRPSAVIVYDLSYHRHPEMAEEKNRVFLERFVPVSLNRAAAVITISEFSRREIAEVYGVPSERIHVAYPGVDTEHFRPVEEPSARLKVLEKYRLPSEFLLFIGTLEPRKGIELLLKAYANWEDKSKPPLVLVGKRGWGNMPTLDRALRGDIPGVLFPGYVSHEDLPLLLSNALAFVYPSAYEGFGMPVLEAMACGTPVICGNCPSFAEIGRDIVISCDAQTPETLKGVIRDTLLSPPSPETLAAGIRRAQIFTWDTTARVIAEGIKSMTT